MTPHRKSWKVVQSKSSFAPTKHMWWYAPGRSERWMSVEKRFEDASPDGCDDVFPFEDWCVFLLHEIVSTVVICWFTCWCLMLLPASALLQIRKVKVPQVWTSIPKICQGQTWEKFAKELVIEHKESLLKLATECGLTCALPSVEINIHFERCRCNRMTRNMNDVSWEWHDFLLTIAVLNLWAVRYTTSSGKASPLSGYGVGLPLSRLHARWGPHVRRRIDDSSVEVTCGFGGLVMGL